LATIIRTIKPPPKQEPAEPKIGYPADHKPGMAVPKGGSSCALCEYYRGEMKCGNEFFIKWNGSENIPAKSPDAYCSDWFESIAPDDYDEDDD
jgi:hypothetical protein